MKLVEVPVWEHPFTCEHCLAKAVATRGDLELARIGSYDEIDYEYYYVECPNCKSHVMLDGDKEPMKGKTKVFVPQDEKSAAHARRNKKWGR